MKALAWHGKSDIRCETVPDPQIQDGRDAIIKVTACAICGSDLHIFDGVIPGMEKGDVLGHETMGEVVEIGPENKALKVGDRVVVPFTISCGQCFFCRRGFYSGCERSNPDRVKAEKLWGHSPAGLFGYSHLLGGFSGGQAEYLRVPFADVGPIKVPQGLSDDQVLFLSDIFPTGYMAAEFCGLKGGETVAVWGCGPVGQFAIRSAFMLGAERVIAIDTVPERLALAASGGAITLDFRKEDIYDRIQELTAGRGADRRTQWRILSDANAGSCQGLARPDRRRFRLCVEGVEIHHALETPVQQFGQQPRTAGKSRVAARRQGRADPVSAAAEFLGRRRAAGRLPQIAPETAALQFRIPASELVCAAHSAAVVRAE